MTAKLHVNDVNPASISSTVSTTASGVNGTTITTAQYIVQKPNGTEATWSGSISGATSTSLVVTYTFATNDLNVAGNYKIYVKCLVSSTPYRTDTFTVPVYEVYA